MLNLILNGECKKQGRLCQKNSKICYIVWIFVFAKYMFINHIVFLTFGRKTRTLGHEYDAYQLFVYTHSSKNKHGERVPCCRKTEDIGMSILFIHSNNLNIHII